MQVILDHIGAYIVAGTIIFLLLNMNLMNNNASQEYFNSSYVQEAATASARVIENDLYRLGYRVPANVILFADTLSVRFLADINNDSIPDTVYYYLNNAVATLDKPFYRKINGTAALIVASFNQFKFNYYDSLGSALTLATLTSQAGRNRVRSIELVSYSRWSSASAQGIYQGAAWQKRITPKNMK
jgi:hypothetical protein